MKIFQNEQEVFDAVWVHINTQGKGCYTTGGGCLYLNKEEGTSCAIGGILPPEIDRKVLDDTSTSGISSLMYSKDPESLKVQEVFQNIEVDFLDHIQTLHDSRLKFRGMEGWRAGMLKLAELYRLQKP